MNTSAPSAEINRLISPDSDLVRKHLDMLEQMVAIDSRSLGVNEFPGDRETPSDMREILHLAARYLEDIGFGTIRVNKPPKELPGATPILLAELHASAEKPTVLMYAHLDKQPYMDDAGFQQWGGIAPTRLVWNDDRSRAQGRGAADDLSGVIAIGMASEALVHLAGGEPGDLTDAARQNLPCNLKVIFETEEESGSISLIDQILQNKSFFEDCSCVIITDVLNPDTGVPGLTISLRGILQIRAELKKDDPENLLSDQAALYKLLATLIRDDHSLNIEAIAKRDIPVTEEERAGYARVPTTVEKQREAGGLLPDTRFVVPETAVDIIQDQLRRSYANARPGHRVAGGVLFGSAGARFQFTLADGSKGDRLVKAIEDHLERHNPYQLQLTVEIVEEKNTRVTLDIVFKSSGKAPHSGVVGGPLPVPELLLAQWVDGLFDPAGQVRIASIAGLLAPGNAVGVRALHVEADGRRWLFENPSASAMVEIRLAPGNPEDASRQALTRHLEQNVPQGFRILLEQDKGGSPWMTAIDAPVFELMMQSLSAGFGVPACLYGCGGSIPFVAKLMDALGDIAPLCIGAYDPACKMHEPGESLSMVDLIGCTRSMLHFFREAPKTLK
ncbi:MAG: M20/M25/M40 family metallo-hydrolase [Nitrospina sp.]|nr:M20/M25/M40 family metallo-hydrolase [Nitrospina sp.]